MRKLAIALFLSLFLVAPATSFAQEPPPKPTADAVEAPKDAPAAVPAPDGDAEAALKEAAEKPAEAVEKPAAEAKVPESPEEVGEVTTALVEAVKTGQWSIVAGLLILLLIWLGRKFKMLTRVPSKAVPWVSAGLGVAAYVGIALANGLELMPALTQGFAAGSQAVGLWEMVFKHFLGDKPEAPAAVDPPDEPTATAPA